MITDHVDIEMQLTTHTCSGNTTGEELFSKVKALYDSNPTQNHLWDMTEADLSQIEGKDLERIAEFVRRYVPDRVGGRTAIVAPMGLPYGLGRMYEAFANIARQKVEIMVFGSLEEAQTWLNA